MIYKILKKYIYIIIRTGISFDRKIDFEKYFKIAKKNYFEEHLWKRIEMYAKMQIKEVQNMR